MKNNSVIGYEVNEISSTIDTIKFTFLAKNLVLDFTQLFSYTENNSELSLVVGDLIAASCQANGSYLSTETSLKLPQEAWFLANLFGFNDLLQELDNTRNKLLFKQLSLEDINKVIKKLDYIIEKKAWNIIKDSKDSMLSLYKKHNYPEKFFKQLIFLDDKDCERLTESSLNFFKNCKELGNSLSGSTIMLNYTDSSYPVEIRLPPEIIKSLISEQGDPSLQMTNLQISSDDLKNLDVSMKDIRDKLEEIKGPADLLRLMYYIFKEKVPAPIMAELKRLTRLNDHDLLKLMKKLHDNPKLGDNSLPFLNGYDDNEEDDEDDDEF